jgi:RHS repeat-associated protein
MITLNVAYANTSLNDVPAPLLVLSSSTGEFRLPGQTAWSANTFQVMGISQVGPAGTLQPGCQGNIQVQYRDLQPMSVSASTYSVGVIVPTAAANWPGLEASLDPPYISADAWNAIYQNLTARVGTTWGQYQAALDQDATCLSQIGQPTNDVDQLFNFEVQQAIGYSPLASLAGATDAQVATPGLSLSFSRTFGATILDYNGFGRFGWGWDDSWDTDFIVESDGAVDVYEPGGSIRRFQPNGSGGYTAEPGDYGTLAPLGGGFTLTEQDGTVTAYNANGSLDYVQDTDGNRITAGWTRGLLTTLTASSGQSLTLAYNAAKLVSSITDSTGRSTTYAYDPSNQYLLSVTDFNGQTSGYSYDTAAGSQALHALVTVTYPGNTHQYFTYDSQGRLAGSYADGSRQPLTYSYSLGQVNATDYWGDTSTYYFNALGLLTKYVDPLGIVTLAAYDSNLNLTKITNAAGQSESYGYNAGGDVTSWTDFLGNTTDFSYTAAFNELASMTDANGNTTSYAYDSSGDLLTTIYANGTSESFTYDPEGDATSFIDPNGQPVNLTHNASGQVTGATFSDGSQYAYTYDTYGDLLTATDPTTGTVTFTYDPVTEYLTKVAYSNGTWLAFTYNAAGQRTQMVDQTGFITNYIYNSAGWLSGLTDGSGNPIVTYHYCICGRLLKTVNGNGTYTTYSYDADDDVTDLVNYAPNGTVNSSFAYTYNSLGLETSETTLDGAWTYTYDADGQLTHAVFASNNPAAVPNQNLSYTYDALGNRMVTVVNGVTTAYVANNMNQYTSVGGVAYKYDADGDLLFDGTNTYAYNSLNELTSVSGPNGTTTYTYNALGQLVSSTTGGKTTQYLVDPTGLGNVVGECDAPGNPIAHYTYGLGLVSRVDAGGAAAYYDFDVLGSTSDVTGTAGQILDHYAYDPFGGLLSHIEVTPNPFQFVGRFGAMSQSNGLDFMRARDYSGMLGRFTTVDPIGLRGGDQNSYRYVFNNPVGFADPAGTCEKEVIQWLKDTITSEVVLKSFEEIGMPKVVTVIVVVFQELPKLVTIVVEHCNFWGDYLNRQFELAVNGPTPTGGGTTIGTTERTDSVDPNGIVGPSAYGSDDFVNASSVLPYTIDFQNTPTATAAAAEIQITQQLDSNLDWSTFQLGNIELGNLAISVPAGMSSINETLDERATLGVYVQLVAGLNANTGVVTWTLTALDPTTMQIPADPLLGLLPPDATPPEGEGSVSYTIRPEAGGATGTIINAQASIVFDVNAPIPTAQIFDTLDAVGPTSSVAALPAEVPDAPFTVAWSAEDDTGGSGIGSCTIYVQEDSGPWSAWLTGTTQTSAQFSGQAGHSYSFYCVATDNVGNVENSAAAAQATTYVVPPPAVTIDQGPDQADPTTQSPIDFSVVFSEPVSDFTSGDVTLSGTAGATTAVVTGSGAAYDVAVSGMAGSGTVIASIAAGVAHDSAGNGNLASTSGDNCVTYDITPPTDITLSSTAIAENSPIGTAVGALGTVDPDNTSGFQYALVPGPGSTDNAAFTISGGELLTATTFNYYAQASYSIRLRSTDPAGLYVEKTFTISVDRTSGPWAVAGGPYIIGVGGRLRLDASGSHDGSPGQQIVDYAWDLTGDGQADIESSVAVVTLSYNMVSFVGIGSHAITLQVTDSQGLTDTTATQFVIDVTPPVLTLPANQVAEATGPTGAVVNFAPAATDQFDPHPSVTATPPSGSVFPLGVTTVTVAATDAYGNRSTGTFLVTVRDTTPPRLTLPADQQYHATSSAGAVVQFVGATATDAVSTPTITYYVNGSAIANDSFLPMGVTTVTAVATDAAGNSSSGQFNVNVFNNPPVADAGGPYIMGVGTQVTFDASASYDPDAAYGDMITSYAWEFNNDGVFTDATGATPTIPYSQFAALGPGSYTISVRVTDMVGATSTASTTLEIRGGAIPGGSGNDAFRIAADPSNSAWADVFLTGAGTTPSYQVDLSSISQWQVTGGAGDDALTVDFSDGDPLPAGGLSFDGGTNAAGDTLQIVGTSGDDTAMLTASRLQFASSDFIDSISYSNVQQFGFDLGGGADSLIISGATLRTPSDGAISAGTAVTIQSGGTLDLGGHADTVDSVLLRNGGIVNGTLLAGSYTLQSGTVSANLAGPGGVFKSTSGIVTLSGDDSYSGGTLISAGTLQAAGPSPDVLPAVGTVKVSGGVLDLGGTSASAAQIVLIAGAIQHGDMCNGSQEVQSGAVSANIGGNGGLWKTTSGTATLSGNNSYSGGTFVTDGTLVVTASCALPNGGALTVGAGGILVFGEPASGAIVSSPPVVAQSNNSPVLTDLVTGPIVLPSPSIATAATSFSAVPPVDRTIDQEFAGPAPILAPSVKAQRPSAGPDNGADAGSVANAAVRARLHDEVLKSAFSDHTASGFAWLAEAVNWWVRPDNSQKHDSEVNPWDDAFIEYGRRGG